VFQLTQRPQTMVTVEDLPGVFCGRMPANDQWFVLTGGAKVTHEPVELGLAHPVGIVRMRIQFV
jgi:hypothetical protein